MKVRIIGDQLFCLRHARLIWHGSFVTIFKSSDTLCSTMAVTTLRKTSNCDESAIIHINNMRQQGNNGAMIKPRK